MGGKKIAGVEMGKRSRMSMREFAGLSKIECANK